MNSYRIYLLNAQERIAAASESVHADDTAALSQAEGLRGDHHAAEVWEGSRLVGRVGGEFSLQARF